MKIENIDKANQLVKELEDIREVKSNIIHFGFSVAIQNSYGHRIQSVVLEDKNFGLCQLAKDYVKDTIAILDVQIDNLKNEIEKL